MVAAMEVLLFSPATAPHSLRAGEISDEQKIIRRIRDNHSISQPFEGEQLKEWVVRSGAQDITILDLSNLDLSVTLPSFVTLLTGLTSLNLDHNNLFFLPEGMGELKSLSHLSWRSNIYQNLDHQLWDLPLTSLDISNNSIHSLSGLGEMEQLEHLVADNLKVYFGNPGHAKDLHNLCHQLKSISVKGTRIDFGFDTTDLERLQTLSKNRMDHKCPECSGE